jgi:hypothetical protein
MSNPDGCAGWEIFCKQALRLLGLWAGSVEPIGYQLLELVRLLGQDRMKKLAS